MKKFVSLAIAVIMIISALAFSVNAGSSTGKDPTYAASESKVIAFKGLKNGNGGNAINSAAMFDKSYAGNNLDPLNDGNDYSTNTLKAEKLKTWTCAQAGTFYTMFSENTGDDRYASIFQVSLGSGTEPELTKISTIVLAVPGAASLVADKGLPTKMAVYYGNEEWQAVQASSTNFAEAVAANKANYKELCTLTALQGTETEPGLFVESADASFRYVEFTLDTPIEAKYLVVGLGMGNYVHYTEFAAFSPAEAATEASAETGTTAPAANTGDNAIIIASVVGAVAVIGMAVSLRKKEYN